MNRAVSRETQSQRELVAPGTLPALDRAARDGVPQHMLRPTPAAVIPVLIVADEGDVAAALAAQVERIGVVARLVESAHGAVEVLLQSTTLLLVVDGRVRRRDGVDLIEVARQISPQTRLLVIEPPETIHALPSDVLALAQPAQPALLRDMIAEALQLPAGSVRPPTGEQNIAAQWEAKRGADDEPVARGRSHLVWVGLLAMVGAAVGALVFVILRADLSGKPAVVSTTPSPRGPSAPSPITTPLDDSPTAGGQRGAEQTGAGAAVHSTRTHTGRTVNTVRTLRTSNELTRANASKAHARARRHARWRQAQRRRARRARQQKARDEATVSAPTISAPTISAPTSALSAPAAPTSARSAPAAPHASAASKRTRRAPRIGTVGDKRKPNIGMID